MRFIITGSKGLIGTEFKKRLEKEGHECVMEIDNRLGSNIININSIELTPSTQKTDVFLHLASYCKIKNTIENPQLAFDNNVKGVYECLEFCRKNDIKKFVMYSSSRILSEEKNPYTASKMYGEYLCEAYKQCYGIEYIIIRPSTVYNGCHDLTTRLITIWAIKALKGEKLPLNGDENKTLDFTHVDDFVDGIMVLLNNWYKTKNDAYDICGEEETKLVDVARMLGGEVEFFPADKCQPQKVNIDISKIKSFGYEPKVKLKEGVERLLEFYKGEGRKWLN